MGGKGSGREVGKGGRRENVGRSGKIVVRVAECLKLLRSLRSSPRMACCGNKGRKGRGGVGEEGRKREEKGEREKSTSNSSLV